MVGACFAACCMKGLPAPLPQLHMGGIPGTSEPGSLPLPSGAADLLFLSLHCWLSHFPPCEPWDSVSLLKASIAEPGGS